MDFIIKDEGSVTSVPGFLTGSSHCGLKKSWNKPDICVMYIPDGAVCSGVFTTNSFCAAPVIIDKQVLSEGGTVKAITVNSGIANACTGGQGMENAVLMQKHTADALGIKPVEVLVASTGVIGKQLPMDKVEKGIDDSVSSISDNGGIGAAMAIMTTDIVKKNMAVTIDMGDGSEITIGAIAKGSGMIEPNMATMLAFLGTDAAVDKKTLDKILSEANAVSFNSITVDGCQSTNDSVFLMANGKSGVSIEEGTAEYDKFLDGIIYVMKEMAKKIVYDGEGATKCIELTVNGAKDDTEAKKAAVNIANSNLFKTAMFGKDLNWGRINAALGSSGCDFKPDNVDIYLGDEQIVKGGIGVDVKKKKAQALLKPKEISITVELKNKKGSWTVWTTDLSFDYIKINALYHT